MLKQHKEIHFHLGRSYIGQKGEQHFY